eukprot:1125661-Amphidinium_carterae.1
MLSTVFTHQNVLLHWLSQVAAILEEKEENVERWVVRALSEGVIDGRIDQLNNKVDVHAEHSKRGSQYALGAGRNLRS